METAEDRRQLALATEMINCVIERHRGEDLRALTRLTSAIQDIRVGARYLGWVSTSGCRGAVGFS